MDGPLVPRSYPLEITLHPLRAHGTSAGRQKHAPGEREAHTLAGFQGK